MRPSLEEDFCDILEPDPICPPVCDGADKCGGAPGGNCRDPDYKWVTIFAVCMSRSLFLFFFFLLTSDLGTNDSIKTGAAYLAQVLKEHNESLLLGLGSYNGVSCSRGPLFSERRLTRSGNAVVRRLDVCQSHRRARHLLLRMPERKSPYPLLFFIVPVGFEDQLRRRLELKSSTPVATRRLFTESRLSPRDAERLVAGLGRLTDGDDPQHSVFVTAHHKPASICISRGKSSLCVRWCPGRDSACASRRTLDQPRFRVMNRDGL